MPKPPLDALAKVFDQSVHRMELSRLVKQREALTTRLGEAFLLAIDDDPALANAAQEHPALSKALNRILSIDARVKSISGE